MAESVYKVIELVGTSTESWEMAAKAVVERAAAQPAGPARGGGHRAGPRDRKWKGRSLSHQAQGFLQVRRQGLRLAGGRARLARAVIGECFHVRRR